MSDGICFAGLDVHARATAAAAVRLGSGEVFRARLTGGPLPARSKAMVAPSVGIRVTRTAAPAWDPLAGIVRSCSSHDIGRRVGRYEPNLPVKRLV